MRPCIFNRLKAIDTTTLPTASLVIVFHEEARSTLLRTIVSCAGRAPAHLLKEIILVDDFSQRPHLLKPLEDELALKYPLVTLIRMPERGGLIRARLAGAKKATGDVIVVLDSHCECTDGWLEPALYVQFQNPASSFVWICWQRKLLCCTLTFSITKVVQLKALLCICFHLKSGPKSLHIAHTSHLRTSTRLLFTHPRLPWLCSPTCTASDDVMHIEGNGSKRILRLQSSQ